MAKNKHEKLADLLKQMLNAIDDHLIACENVLKPVQLFSYRGHWIPAPFQTPKKKLLIVVDCVKLDRSSPNEELNTRAEDIAKKNLGIKDFDLMDASFQETPF